jgi:mRNA-degrading endonuclease toxin of MazEF toxin-antitoxin module
MTRGDIVYVRCDKRKSTGSEWANDRPAIIVSNDVCNKHSPVVEVVFTTTSRRKHLLPTHVIVHSTPAKSVVLCESVYSVDRSRIDRIIGHCSEKELFRINKALVVSLGLKG